MLIVDVKSVKFESGIFVEEVDVKEGWKGWMTIVFAAGLLIFIEYFDVGCKPLSTGTERWSYHSSFVFISDLYVSATLAMHQADDYLSNYSSIKVSFAAASPTQTYKSYLSLLTRMFGFHIDKRRPAVLPHEKVFSSAASSK